MTEQEYVQKVRELARERGVTLDPGDIRDSLLNALTKLAALSLETDWRSLLENDYPLAISGASAPFTANTDLLPESIVHCRHVTHPTVPNRFRILESVDDLDYAGAVSDSTLAFAAVSATAVHFRYPLGTLTGTLAVRAVKIPTIATVPLQLEDRLVDIGAMLAVGKVERAQEATEAR